MSSPSNGIRLLILLAVCIYALLLTHAGALWYAWYWTYPWFDILTHFWGGACVALGTVWIIRHARYAPLRWRQSAPLIAVVVTIAVIGVVWEAYEWVVQSAFGLTLPPNYVPDTLLDLVMDTTGALFGLFCLRLATRKQKDNEVIEVSSY